jgi:hypothetical protein
MTNYYALVPRLAVNGKGVFRYDGTSVAPHRNSLPHLGSMPLLMSNAEGVVSGQMSVSWQPIGSTSR